MKQCQFQNRNDEEGEEEDDEDEDEDSFECSTCHGSGGGPEHWRCPECHGTGQNVAAKRRSREEYLEDYWADRRKDERDF